MLLQGRYCHVSAGQPSCVLYTTVISKIILEIACSFVVLIGGVEVKFKDVLDGVLNLFRYEEVFTASRSVNSNLWAMQWVTITGLPIFTWSCWVTPPFLAITYIHTYFIATP